MSRKEMLHGLMHAAQQGQKMREGTELAKFAAAKAKESMPVTDRIVAGTNNFIGVKIPNAVRVQPKEPNATQTHVPGKNLSIEKVEPTRTLPGTNMKVFPSNFDPNTLLVRKIDRRDPAAEAEQRRRENSEAEMRRRSAPDAAINREPVMPSQLESYSNSRRNTILETVSQILEATGMRQRVVSGGRQRGDEGSVRYAKRRAKILKKDKEEGWVGPESSEGDDLPIPGRRKRFRVPPKARED